MTPEEARATDRERLAEVLAEQFGDWLFRMHRVISSCDHAAEGEGLADAVLDYLAERDQRIKAETLREAADETDLSRYYDPTPTGGVSTTCYLAENAARDWLRDRADRIEGGEA